MKTGLIAALLACCVLAVYLSAAGFVRLSRPLDRLHCISFASLASGVAVLLAALAADGATTRVLKIALLEGLLALSGAVLVHATGRAIETREAKP